MATRQGNVIIGEDHHFYATWIGITESDSGTPVSIPRGFKEVSVQAVGDFTTSGAVTLQGSNDGTNYATLQDVGGTDIVMTTTKVWRLGSNPKFIKPTATAGTAVSMDIYLHGTL